MPHFRPRGVQLAAALLFFGTGNLPLNGHWYSVEPSFRIQSASLTAGHFALTDSPSLLAHDWAWTQGKGQQIWGLGVPLMRLPLDIVSHTLTSNPFPDRLALFLLALVSGMMTLSGFHGVSGKETTARQPPLQLLYADIALLVLMFSSPPLIGLLEGRFFVYEEAIAWGYFWIWLCLGLAWKGAASRRFFYLSALCSGFSVFFRPTLLLYGAVLFLSLLPRRCGKERWCGAVYFALSPAAWLITNHYRFGSALEFGHGLSLSDQPLLNLALKFGSPFSHEAFLSAARELLGFLFFAGGASNGFDFFKEHFFAGQSPTLRFRELYFFSYDWLMLVILLVAWVFAGLSARRALAMRQNLPLEAKVGVVSFLSSAALFLFYLRAPSLASRFSADFAPAFSLATLSLITLLMHRPVARLPALAALVALHSWWITQRFTGPEHGWQSGLAHAGPTQLIEEPIANLPKSYECPPRELLPGIIHLTSGWALGTDCSVRGATPLFFHATPCIAITTESLEKTPPFILVKREGASFDLKNVSATPYGHRMLFCEQTPSNSEPLPTPQLFWLAWSNPADPSRESSRFQVRAITATIN